jgi:DNA-binding transcriptional ArsR family regulator
MAETRRVNDEEHANNVLRALNHELRRRIMRLLLVDRVKVVSPTEVSRRLEVPLSNVSYHFRVLAQSRAVDMTQERPVRGSVKHFYRANRAVAKMPMVAEVLNATSPVD